MTRLHSLIVLALLAAVAVLIFGCGSDPAGPGGDPDPDPDPEPNPDGVLLEGDDGDGAVGALVHLPPSPAPDHEIVEGLFTTRLNAMVDPDATVGEINAALDAAGARIVSMHPDDIFLTLKIPAVVDEDEAGLVASGAFVFVMTAHQPDLTPPDVDKLKDMPPYGAQPIHNLRLAKFPAAWTAKDLALTYDEKMIVVVPDYYTADLPHPDIGCQQMLAGWGDPTLLVIDGYHVGNHGYGVCSVIGADFDADGATGTSPAPRNLLEIRSVHVGGLTWPEKLREIHDQLPTDTPFVLNTSLGYNEPNTADQKLRLALDSILWRSLIAGGSHDFLHACSARVAGRAGVQEESRYNSPFTTAHMFDDLTDVINGAGVSERDSLELEVAWTYHVAVNPDFASPLQDVLVVGSSDWGGAGERVLEPRLRGQGRRGISRDELLRDRSL